MRTACGTPQILRADRADDAETWDTFVTQSPTPDVYFRPGYVAAYAGDDATPLALVVSTSTRSFLVPLLLRRLTMLPPSSGVEYDAITPYGYGGVLPLQAGEFTREDGAELLEQLSRWCLEANVVSCLLRLHPLLRQHHGFSAAVADCAGAALRVVGPTAAVDLASWDDGLSAPTGLHKGRRSDLRHARRHLNVKIAPSDSHQATEMLHQFRSIYEQTMSRVHASQFYFFPEQYYRRLRTVLGDDLAVGVAYFDKHPVSAALFLADSHFGHYHLSGATAEGRFHKAPTAVLVEGARWVRRRGCRWLHLGGGREPGDSLYFFKHSFGAHTFEYSYVTLIADQARYHALVNLRKSRTPAAMRSNGFFPAYRGPEE